MANAPTDPAVPVGRLAPSPTGLLHLGHAWAFLLAWVQMRSQGGHLWLRMEDLDSDRCRPEYETAILEDLTWLGLEWDGPWVRQSERLPLYQAALGQLTSQGRTYPCTCSRKEIAEAQSAPHAAETQGGYPGTCRGRYESPQQALTESGKSAALRVEVPEEPIQLQDELWGTLTENLSETCGDFPVARRDTAPAYQLAVVVDDHEQGVTDVLRGADLLQSTPRQRFLQHCLGYKSPRWHHIPLVTDLTGQRLAKRSDSLSLQALRQRGVTAEAIVGWAAEHCGVPHAGPMTPQDWLAKGVVLELPEGSVPVPETWA